MLIGDQVVCWRRHRGVTQADLAKQIGVARPSLARLEAGRVDPTLSSLKRVALALGITVGQLIDEPPAIKSRSRFELDGLARAAFHPGARQSKAWPERYVVARMIQERKAALGLSRSRRIRKVGALYSSRWLRLTLGETQWRALCQRLDKLAAGYASAA